MPSDYQDYNNADSPYIPDHKGEVNVAQRIKELEGMNPMTTQDEEINKDEATIMIQRSIKEYHQNPDLTGIEGYDAEKIQCLTNDKGTLKWIDAT